MQKGIFILFGIALMLGWFLAGADPIAPHDNVITTQAAVRADQRSDDADAEDSAEPDEETVLARQADGHFYANVDVNSSGIRFMVDTGATGIALTGDDAEALGLVWNNDELRVVGRGVSGNVYGKPVKLRLVQLGDLQTTNVDAVVIPNGLDVSLLGQSFLSKAASVKIENDQMVIG
jgi:aspartyl protease family protein